MPGPISSTAGSMPQGRRIVLCALTLALTAWAAATGAPAARTDVPAQPRAPVRIVTSELHGTTLIDPHRWMEDVGSDELQAWARGQNAHTRATLDRLPIRGDLLARIKHAQLLLAPCA